MTDVAGLLSALSALPPTAGLFWHGAVVPPVSAAIEVRGLLAMSEDPRIATENFSTPVIFAVIAKRGRAVGPLSAHPHEKEVLLLPGTVLSTLQIMQEPGAATVVVMEELGESGAELDWLPATLEELGQFVIARLSESVAGPAAEISAPGKFTAAIE
jgi:hypothetical protein